MRRGIRIVAAALTVAGTLWSISSQAQHIHCGETFELGDSLASNQDHRYTASNYIELKKGFVAEPDRHRSTLLQLEPFGVFPPEMGLTGGPDESNTGVVGAINGVLDVGMMGAAVYSIPIELPSGINGMQPSLSITYNSQSGNGLLGWGWDLAGLSVIERTGRTRYHDQAVGTVTMNDTTDRFLLDGMRLVALADYIDSVEFKTEQDGMSKIMAYYDHLSLDNSLERGPLFTLSHFKVWKNDGCVYEYGITDDSRLTLENSGPKAFRWYLSRISDRYGNSVSYHYTKNTNDGECCVYAIDYTEHAENGAVIVNPEFTVNFRYRSSARQDYDYSYVAGNRIQCRKLLDHISVQSNSADSELERYSFVYQSCVPSQFYDSVVMHDRLDSIFLEKGGSALNPTKIVWSSYEDGNVMSSVRIYDTAVYKNYPFVGDFNGDGYSDLAVVPHMDSVYTHSVDVNFFLNNPSGLGSFVHAPSMTLGNQHRNLDWIYPIDLNDDGLDDLVVCFYDSIAQQGKDTMCVKVFENVGGTHFTLKDSICLGNRKFMVRTGDFLGTGGQQLLLFAMASQTVSPTYLIHYNDGERHIALTTGSFQGVCDIAAGDFNGDGRDEVMFVKENGSTVYNVGVSNTQLSLQQKFSISSINHFQGKWHHVFTGDFNGDGKTDLLYSDKLNGSNRWRIFHSTGSGFSPTDNILAINYYVLPSGNLYTNSLRKMVDAESYTTNGSGYYYSLCAADFDGDNVTDIAFSKMSPQSSDITVFFHYNPSTNAFQSRFSSGYYNGSHNTNPDYFYINCRDQYFRAGKFLDKENLSFLGLEYRNSGNNYPVPSMLRRPAVFCLKPASALNSVSKIIDGLGNETRLGYGYVQQSYQDFSHGVRRMPMPLRVLASVSTDNVAGQPMRTAFVYRDPCYHRDGHGWLGFMRMEKWSYQNGILTGKSIATQSLATMTTHAMLLPETDTAYVYPEGSQTPYSATAYQFEKVCSSYGNLNPRRLVTCPALTGKTVVSFNPECPGAVLSKTFVENHYNYTDGEYYHTYRCDSTRTGVGGDTAESYGDCEFRSVESTAYYYDYYSSWTINKPHSVTLVRSRTGKTDVSRCKWFEYVSPESYQVSRTYDIPGRVPAQQPLMVQTDFQYLADGNLSCKVVSAPHGMLGEQQKTYGYEYGPGGQHRLVTRETLSCGGLSYETSYSYDNYDRVDTLTSGNGLVTSCIRDAFGVTSSQNNPDGTVSCTALRWAHGHPLAPSNAAYYVWNRSSSGGFSMTFFHKDGTELRSVRYGLHGEAVITDRQYDESGRLSALSEPYKEGETPRWTEYRYDNLDRLVYSASPDSTETFIVRDGFRTATTVTAPGGTDRMTTETVNEMGWTVQLEDPSGASVTYDHCADGLISSATVNGNSATTVTAAYDDARNRSQLTDPDYGTVLTAYDAYGRPGRSSSPREQAAQTWTSWAYDGLDRTVSVTDGLEGTVTQYSYNETGRLKGTLAETLFREQGGNSIQRIAYGYDTLARPVSVTEYRGEWSYTTAMEYDAQSRVARLVYPSGIAVRYGYRHGYLKDVTDDNGNLLWCTGDIDASGQLLEARLGNGAVTRCAYDTLTHRLKSIVTTKNLQDLSCDYDYFGNLAARKDNLRNMEERFTYDDMNRLTGVTQIRANARDMYCQTSYDLLGRMTSKQAVSHTGTTPLVSTVFSSPVFDNTKIHAPVTASMAPDVFPTASQSVSYTAFDKVRTVRQGNDSIRYTYGYDRQRILMEEWVGDTLRTKHYVGACERRNETTRATDTWRWWTPISGPFGVFAVMESGSGFRKLHYILKDNLGSWTVVTDDEGAVEQELSFDAWGNRRDPATWTNYTAGDTYARPMFDRGFTGHEHLQAFGLINMNGRMYDPVMSSFLSPDRYIQDPTTAQGFNRYAYCMYNPLRFTDPTGWKAGVGGGYHPNGPLKQVLVDGQPSFELPEVTITPYEDKPVLKEDFWNTASSWGGGGGNRGALWDPGDDNPSIGPDLNNSGGGSRSGKINQSKPDNIDIISIVITSANLYTSTQAALYYDPLTKTWTDKLGIRRSFDFNGNQYTGGKNSFGKLMSKRFTNAGRILGLVGVGLSYYQFDQATTMEGKFEYGFDTFMGVSGVVAPELFGLPSTIWFLGGKQVTYWYAKTTIIPMIENGINPGLMENQPFK